jgi:hypothetical protein
MLGTCNAEHFGKRDSLQFVNHAHAMVKAWDLKPPSTGSMMSSMKGTSALPQPDI